MQILVASSRTYGEGNRRPPRPSWPRDHVWQFTLGSVSPPRVKNPWDMCMLLRTGYKSGVVAGFDRIPLGATSLAHTVPHVRGERQRGRGTRSDTDPAHPK
jgi:hypothetical protein